MDPLLKWPGGKRKLAPLISAAFGRPCAGRYFEPFAGSAAVFLARRAAGEVRAATLSDVNPRLIALHRAVRDAAGSVIRELELLPADRERYDEIRAAYNAAPRGEAGAAQAARLLWLNRACFNGLYRENAAGDFNVSAGSGPIYLPTAERIREVSAALQGVGLLAVEARQALRSAGPGDQVYLDPPYLDTFSRYASGGYSLPDHYALAFEAREAAARGARVVVSNSAAALEADVYPASRGWRLVDSPMVERRISRDAATRTPTREIIVAIGD